MWYLQYWDVNNSHGWEMPQKFPVNNYEWKKHAFEFNEDFIKSYNEESYREEMKDEWKQVEGIFPQNMINDLIRDKLLICKVSLKKDNLNYKSKCGKTYSFGKCSLTIVCCKRYTWRIFIIRRYW